MNLVDRNDMLKMPKGTIYQEWAPLAHPGPLMFKWHNVIGDVGWYYTRIGANMDLAKQVMWVGNRQSENVDVDLKVQYLIHSPWDIKIIIEQLSGNVTPNLGHKEMELPPISG